MTENSTYRIRTELNQTDPTVLNVQLNQTYDTLEILSLKLDQSNSYKLFESGFGVICGRVTCSGFGIPNAKVGLFVEVKENASVKDRLIYNYSSTNDTNNDGVVYNLLPNFVDSKCHQDVGTFPSKRQWLDSSETTVQIYEDYYQFTTTSGPCGDFMIICPSGNAILHCDVDLSDIGNYLSQRPLDLEAKGYSATQFDSPNKFKKSTNLRELSQLYSQDKGLYVYPYWGDQSELSENIAITRVDFDIDYNFTPSAIFIGSAITDKGNNAINQKCKPRKSAGKMSELATSSGTISMIRKTPSGKIEQFQIMGDQLIDNDGVWCYQIPMNLDYVKMDEFGNVVPTDDVENGLPTRARVRFRFTLNDTTEDGTARKRCSYLVPNNPRIDGESFPKFTNDDYFEPDYEFGSLTHEESFKDIFWNNVYTVKNYIPKLQTNHKTNSRSHTGIKWTSFFEANNPFPYNSLTIRRSVSFSFMCTFVKLFKDLVTFLNQMITIIGLVPCLLKWFFDLLGGIFLIGAAFKFILKPVYNIMDFLVPTCIKLGSEFCDDEVNQVTYIPGCGKLFFTGMSLPGFLGGCVEPKTEKSIRKGEYDDADSIEEYEASAVKISTSSSGLVTCFENQLIQENEIVSFNFNNDWINGCLYFPLWYRKIRPKKSYLFGLIKHRAKDQWCSNNSQYPKLRIQYVCPIQYEKGDGKEYNNYVGTTITPYYKVTPDSDHKYHEKYQIEKNLYGIVKDKETMAGDTVYYYVPTQYYSGLEPNTYTGNTESGELVFLFATDIVLLGNIQECNLYGIPQFFENLESTTYKLPNDILDLDTETTAVVDEDGNLENTIFDDTTTETGCDWGNKGSDQCGSRDDADGGVFYGIGCSTIDVRQKSCLNLMRICELGVSVDAIQTIENLSALSGNENDEGNELTPDGFISYDELSNLDQRSMFATMNSNNLRTRYNNDKGFYEYEFHYLYPENFDGSLLEIMEERQSKNCSANYKNNYKLEGFSQDYYNFRMGEVPYYYTNNSNDTKAFPRFENSFYFYFGLTEGKTAINKFNDNYYATCEDLSGEMDAISVSAHSNDWCSEVSTDESSKNGYVEIDASNVETPYSIILNCTSNSSIGFEINDITDEKIVICNEETFATLSGDNYDYVNPSNCQFNVPNGEYELTVTDANGENVTVAFIMKNKYLTYYVDSMDFKVGNDTLLSTYGSYQKIAIEPDGCSNDEAEETDFAYRCSIGGVLKIYNVYYNNEYLPDFKLTVYSDEFFGSGFEWPYVIVKNGTVTEHNTTLTTNANGDSGSPIYIGVPYGGITYTVEITQQCNGVDSANSVKQKVFINKAVDLKLYINDIDYDLISRWTGGVNNLGNKNGDELVGWLKMSDEKQYNWSTCKEADTAINSILAILVGWDNVTVDDKTITNSFSTNIRSYLMPDGHSWPFNDIDMENQDDVVNQFIDDMNINVGVDEKDNETIRKSIYNAIYDFYLFKESTIASVKSAFMFTCPDSTVSLELNGETSNGNYPLEFKIWGREETTDENTRTQTLANNVASPENFGEDVYSVTTIGIPTISNTDSDEFRSSDILVDNPYLCFADDNSSSFSNNRKFPYYVAVRDSGGSILPTAVTDFDTSNNRMFVVHFIDKTMEWDFISWSCFEDIPYFEAKEDGDYSCPINLNGFVAGWIKNGISATTNGPTGAVTFSSQTIDGEDVDIYNIERDSDVPQGQDIYDGRYEDQFPTERVLSTDIDCGNDGTCFGFANYEVVSAEYIKNENIKSQCAIIPNKTCALNISTPDGCYMTIDIYGRKKINYVSYEDETLTVSVTGGGDNETYYIFSIDETHTYPLNAVVMEYDDGTEENPNEPCTVITKAYLDMTGSNTAWDGTNGAALFSFQTTENVLKDNVEPNFTSTYYDMTDFGYTPLETNGYGSTGVFNGVKEGNKVFIVAVDSDNCRAISPVYDFTIPTVKLDWKTEDDNYYFGITITDPPYYLKTYTSIEVEIVCQGITSGTITNAHPFSEGGVYYTIPPSIYETISTYNSTHFTSSLKDITTVKITDYVGVPHNCTVND